MPKSRSSNSSGGGPSPSSGGAKLCEECGMSTSSRNHSCGGVDSPESIDSDHQNERRRSERVKREKPDYYDASEFEKKTRKQRVVKSAASSKSVSPKKSHHRATLTWKKTGDECEEEKDKKKRKRSRQRDSELSEELPPEKTFQCKVGLAEINRKLGVVMFQPKL